MTTLSSLMTRLKELDDAARGVTYIPQVDAKLIALLCSQPTRRALLAALDFMEIYFERNKHRLRTGKDNPEITAWWAFERAIADVPEGK